jgi:hypothetical protein
VIITGLQTRPELNGSQATLVKAAENKEGRFNVLLADGSTVSLRPANFVAAAASSSSTTQSPLNQAWVEELDDLDHDDAADDRKRQKLDPDKETQAY